jgi:hypothetical protein
MAPSSWFKRFWTHVKEGRPGHRFQDHYHHAREAHGRSAMWKRALKIVGGVLALLIGLVEIVFPGPAFVFIIVGGAMLATESLRIARIMDWCELRVRRLWTYLRRRWRDAQPSS